MEILNISPCGLYALAMYFFMPRNQYEVNKRSVEVTSKSLKMSGYFFCSDRQKQTRTSGPEGSGLLIIFGQKSIIRNILGS